MSEWVHTIAELGGLVVAVWQLQKSSARHAEAKQETRHKENVGRFDTLDGRLIAQDTKITRLETKVEPMWQRLFNSRDR